MQDLSAKHIDLEKNEIKSVDLPNRYYLISFYYFHQQ